MRLLMIGLIVLVLVAGSGTIMLVKHYLERQADVHEPAAQHEEPETLVLVAKKHLPPGTKISSDSLHWQPWPEDAVEDEYQSAERRDEAIEKKFLGNYARRAVMKGTPLTEKMIFRRDAAKFMAGSLAEGMRAVAVSVDAIRGAGGFVSPGDRVDILLTFDIKNVTRGIKKAKKAQDKTTGPLRYSAETVLRGVRVMAIDQDTAGGEEDAKIVKTVTLELTPKQVERLAVARLMGQISLALRSLEKDPKGDGARGFTGDLAISPTLRAIVSAADQDKKNGAKGTGKKTRAQRQKDRAGRRAARRSKNPPPPSGSSVSVYRGGKASKQTFAKASPGTDPKTTPEPKPTPKPPVASAAPAGRAEKPDGPTSPASLQTFFAKVASAIAAGGPAPLDPFSHPS